MKNIANDCKTQLKQINKIKSNGIKTRSNQLNVNGQGLKSFFSGTRQNVRYDENTVGHLILLL